MRPFAVLIGMAHFEPKEPFEALFKKVMRRIKQEQRLLVVKRLAAFSIILAGSAAAFVPAFRMVSADFAESGFVEFFSLIFSDSALITAYWQNFVFVLLESLPVMSMIVFLITVLAFLSSLKYIVRDARVVFAPLNNN